MLEQRSVIASSETTDDSCVVRLQGDIDFSRSPELRNGLLQIVEQGAPRLILDLSEVPYMDSSGVAVLVEILQKQRKKDSKLVLCNMQSKVKGIFEISQLHKVFAIVDDLEAAAKT